MVGKDKKYKIVDLFSGVGGLSLGFEENNFDLIFANDNDKLAGETFIHNHPNTKFFCGDIKELSTEKLSNYINTEVDVIVGGVPCQSFSMAGYRIRKKVDNSSDPRHYLFKEFIRVVKTLKPKVVIIENVKGILSSHKGKIKEEIITELENLGYNVDFKVLNSADFGVPQLRERVIFMGNRLGKENIFPEPTHSKDNYVSVGEALKDIPNLNHEPRILEGVTLERVKLIKPGQNWQSLPKELQTKSNHSGAYGRLDPKKPSRTLTTRFDSPPVGYVTHPTENRTLTVREGARIQSFPDNFEFKGNRMAQYKQVGNAVPVGLSRALSKAVRKLLN